MSRSECYQEHQSRGSLAEGNLDGSCGLRGAFFPQALGGNPVFCVFSPLVLSLPGAAAEGAWNDPAGGMDGLWAPEGLLAHQRPMASEAEADGGKIHSVPLELPKELQQGR